MALTDSVLWTKVKAFDFDYPPGEYGFSVRMAYENQWTEDFTENALLEYKKFMYLAAISDLMVSPSEIVDVVWHQHLIFTQSYQAFCDLLGKKIEHVPSTHNRADFEKFTQAKKHTNALYESTFGPQPNIYWDFESMYAPVSLAKSRIKLGTFLLLGIFAFIILLFPMYYLLKPVYVQIDNPYFLIGYCGLAAVAFIILEAYNTTKLFSLMSGWDKAAFLFHLSPSELVYLSNRNLSHIVHELVNKLISEKKVKADEDFTLSLKSAEGSRNIREYCIMEVLRNCEKMHYRTLLKLMVLKPVFKTIHGSMEAFRKYFIKSHYFVQLFSLNFVVLTGILLLGLIRLMTGLSNDKPILYIAVVLGLYSIAVFIYLSRLTNLLSGKTVPDYYKSDVIPNQTKHHNEDWQYFLHGKYILAASFLPLYNYSARNEKNGGGACGNSGGSSCGSGCGSSCGGGCGGCGGGD